MKGIGKKGNIAKLEDKVLNKHILLSSHQCMVSPLIKHRHEHFGPGQKNPTHDCPMGESGRASCLLLPTIFY